MMHCGMGSRGYHAQTQWDIPHDPVTFDTISNYRTGLLRRDMGLNRRGSRNDLDRLNQQLYQNSVKIINFFKFRSHIWTHHEKNIQISANMPSIGVVNS